MFVDHRLDAPYMPPAGVSPSLPLGRFLPLCPSGVLSAWLKSQAEPETWVLDPFGSTPATSIQAAQAGFRVLAAVNNPLLAFELEMLCHATPRGEYQAALAELASSRRGDMRLEVLIQSFYLTICSSCGREIQASAFIWKRNEKAPYARIYHCPHCGDEGIHPAIESDISRLAPLLRAEPLHRARALEKAIAPGMDEDEKHNVEEALKNYPVRALVVIFNLLNKLDALPANSADRRLLQALLLPVLDAGTNLWPWPETPEAPRLLQAPAEFMEKNLWMELETAIDAWQNASTPLELTHWPALPKEAGICIYPGRARELHNEGHDLVFKAAICNLPRPSQAFWTLSALWSAWVWGKEVSARYTGVLSRRRFDWHWHARALHSTFEAMDHTTQLNTPVFGLISEASPGFVLAAASAATAAGLKLNGFACNSDRLEVQFHWRTNSPNLREGEGSLQAVLRQAIRTAFTDLGQPSSYLQPLLAGVSSLAEANLLPQTDEKLTPEIMAEIQSTFASLLLDSNSMHHYDSTAQEIEPGSWFVKNPEDCAEPLNDRVETEIVRLLLNNESMSLSTIQHRVYTALPGILTPNDNVIQACLGSYGDHDPKDDTWHLKQGETSAERKTELKEMHRLLKQAAKRLGYLCEGDQVITWRLPSEERQLYQFFLGASAVFQAHACQAAREDIQSVYVFPGSRAAFIQFKLTVNPHLRELTRTNWHFLKFRYLESLAIRAELNPEIWMMLLDGDPLSSEKDTQLSIFI